MQVNPDEVWLRGESDNKAYYPSDQGRFSLEGLYLFGSTLIVEGSDIPPVSAATPTRTMSSTATSASSHEAGSSASFQKNALPPAFHSVIRKSSNEAKFSTKIVKARMSYSRNGKVDFTTLAQMLIDLTESTANVNYILDEVHQRWGDDYSIVTIDGLVLEDCEGNRGMSIIIIIVFTT